MATRYVSTIGSNAYDGSNPTWVSGSVGPWLTLAWAASHVVAGDRVELVAGTYQASSVWAADGTSAAPITITNYAAGAVFIDGATNTIPVDPSVPLLKVNGDWYIVQNIEIRYSKYGGLQFDGANCVADNVVAHHNNTFGILSGASSNEIKDCETYQNCLSNYQASGDTMAGIRVTSGTGCSVHGCLSYENWGGGIEVARCTSANVYLNTAYNNYTQLALADCITSVVQQNLLYATPSNQAVAYCTQHGLSLMSWGYSEAATGNTVKNNLVAGNERNFVADEEMMTAALVAFNTFYNARDTAGAESANLYFYGGTGSATFENNIIQQDDAVALCHLEMAGITFDYNNWSALPVAGARGAHDVTGDPLLAEAGPYGAGTLTAAYFMPTASTPSLGDGLTISGISTDYLGHGIAAPPDMGALQFAPTLAVSPGAFGLATSTLSLVPNDASTQLIPQAAALGSVADGVVLYNVATDFLGRSQQMVYALEVWNGSAWLNLCDLGGVYYLKSLTMKLGGAGVTAAPVAGTWTAVLANDEGLFHPSHPTSPYATLLRVGRKVQISVGRISNNVTYLEQRMAGVMDAPRFSHGSRTVSISGLDYGRYLTDTILRHPANYFGAVAVFNSISSSGVTGAELYAHADAAAVTGDEANTVNAAWVDYNCASTSVADAGGGSTYVMRTIRGAVTGTAWTHDATVATVVADTMYQISFKAKYAAGTEYATFQLYQTLNGTLTPLGERLVLSDAGYADYVIMVTALKSGALEARVGFSSKQSAENDEVRLDGLTIKKHDPTWYRYTLPEQSNGPFYVTLNDVPCYSGADEADRTDQTNWHYNELLRQFFFSKTLNIADGAANLLIYYYTDQTPEGAVARILAKTGLYGAVTTDQEWDTATALALADMDYVATGVVLHRVGFPDNPSAMDCVRMVCERVNYRFWFNAVGRPCFKPAPVAGVPVFTFPGFADLRDLNDFQDRSQIHNRVTIEGTEQDIFNVTKERVSSRVRAEVVDQTSIGAYGPQDRPPVTNSLFETEPQCAEMAAILLAEGKDPKLYAGLDLFANVAPIRLGDTVQWTVAFDAAATITSIFSGIVRDIAITGPQFTYTVEVAQAMRELSDSTLVVHPCAGPLQASHLSMVQDSVATVLGPANPGLGFAASSPVLVAGADTDLYDENDAMEKVAEVNAINPHWQPSNCTISSAADAGGGSTYVGLIVRGDAPGDAYVHSAHVANLTAGVGYTFALDYRNAVGDYYCYMRLYQLVGGVLTLLDFRALDNNVWGTEQFNITALATAALQMRLSFSAQAVEGDQLRIDDITIKAT